MPRYHLVLRSTDRHDSAGDRLRDLARATLSMVTDGLVPAEGHFVLDIQDASSGAFVARWEDPPPAESSGVWLPELQRELDATGLDAFRAKYLAAPSARDREQPPVWEQAPSTVPETVIDEDALDRLWDQRPPR